MDNINQFKSIPYELIFKICSNCLYSELFNLELTCKRFNKLRLYRLYISFLLINRLSGSFDLYKDDMKFLRSIAKSDYSLIEYLMDINWLFFKNLDTLFPDRYSFNTLKYNYKYYNSRNVINIIKYDHKIQETKSDHDTLKEYKHAHHIYRVNSLVYNHLRRNHMGILALIY